MAAAIKAAANLTAWREEKRTQRRQGEAALGAVEKLRGRERGERKFLEGRQR